VKEIEKIASRLTPSETHIEKHKNDLNTLTIDATKLQKEFEELKQTIDNLPIHYSFLLHIGAHWLTNNEGKPTVYEIHFPHRLDVSKMNLQVTLIHDTIQWLDDIVSVIRNYKVYGNSDVLRLELLTFRSTFNHSYWGLNLKACLLVTLFTNTIHSIKHGERYSVTSGVIKIPLPK